jgi:hypothetical protein
MSIPKKAIALANEIPEALSCLYDLDLLPEQIEEGSRDEWRMVVIVSHFGRMRERLIETDP